MSNNNNEIVISFIYDKEHFLDVTKKVYDYEMSHSGKKYIGWFFIAVLQFGIVGALKHGAYGLLYIATFLLFYWYILRWQIRKYIALSWFHKQPFKNKKFELTITPLGLEIAPQGSFVSYKDIQSYKVLDSGVLLFYCRNGAFIPKNAFENIESYNKFLKYLQQIKN